MDFFNAVRFSEAVDIVASHLPTKLFSTEKCPLEMSCGRILTENIYAKSDFPSFRRSTVDGYAVFARDTGGASESIPAVLTLEGSVKMGKTAELSLKKGSCAYVPTGGEIPDGANSVVMIEHTAAYSDKIAVFRPVAVGENLIGVGDDVSTGMLTASTGEVISPLLIGKLAMSGESEVSVYPLVRAAVISTGDELVAIGTAAKKGQIVDVNRLIISEMLKKANAEVVRSTLIRDDYNLLKEEIIRCTQVADVVFLSGGSSVGQTDYTYRLLSELGDVHFHGVAMKPGKPTIFASTDSCAIFGLPGNPIAAVLTYKSLFEEVLLERYFLKRKKSVMATTAMNFPSSPGKTTVALLKVESRDGEYVATPVFYRSGLISKMTAANGYTVIGENTEGIDKGAVIEVVLL